MNKKKFLRKQKKLFSQKKLKYYIVFLVGFLIAMLIFSFFERYTLQSPIVIRPFWKSRFISPIGNIKATEMVRRDTIEDFTVSPTPSSTPTPSPAKKPVKRATGADKGILVANSKYPAFISHIWLRESGKGTDTTGLNGYCIAQGKTNEFGFYPSGKHCFDSFEASIARLERWREETAKGLTDNEALCLYNMGHKTPSCAYLGTDFLSMN